MTHKKRNTWHMLLSSGELIKMPSNRKDKYGLIKNYGIEAVIHRIKNSKHFKKIASNLDGDYPEIKSIIMPNGTEVTQF